MGNTIATISKSEMPYWIFPALGYRILLGCQQEHPRHLGMSRRYFELDSQFSGPQPDRGSSTETMQAVLSLFWSGNVENQ